MPALICGSLAFDTITTFPGRFADQILPDQVHILNVSFLVPTLRREFGGCAGNIAYNLHLLGGKPVILGALGVDGSEYLARVDAWGADSTLVHRDTVPFPAWLGLDSRLRRARARSPEPPGSGEVPERSIGLACYPSRFSRATRVRIPPSPPLQSRTTRHVPCVDCRFSLSRQIFCLLYPSPFRRLPGWTFLELDHACHEHHSDGTSPP